MVVFVIGCGWIDGWTDKEAPERSVLVAGCGPRYNIVL